MAGLFGSAPDAGTLASSADDLQIGTSCYGRPLPIVYGTCRVAPNVFWMPPEFWTRVEGQKPGKGGYDAGSQDTYYQGVGLAICEGPISGIGRVWRDKEVFNSLAEVDGGAFTFFNGARSQAPWTFFSSPLSTGNRQAYSPNSSPTFTVPDPAYIDVVSISYEHDSYSGEYTVECTLRRITSGTPGVDQYRVNGNVVTFGSFGNTPIGDLTVTYSTGTPLSKYAIGYGGTAYVISPKLCLGNSNTLKNFNFEVRGFFSDNVDADPADVIQDLLTNAIHGGALSPGSVVTDVGPDGAAASSYRAYCAAMGFRISMLVDEQRSIVDHVTEILEATNSAAFWSSDGGGKLKIVPLGDTAVGSYVPANTPLYDLALGNFVVDDPADDPIEIERVSHQQTFNCCPVEYTERQAAQPWRPNTAYVYGDLCQNGTGVYVCTTPGTSGASGGPVGSPGGAVPINIIPDGTVRWKYSSAAAANAYSVSVVEHVEQSDVNASNGQIRKDSAIHLACITNLAHAQVISQIRTRRSVYVRNTYRFTLGWKHALLEPYDLVTIPGELLGGAGRKVVRILPIDEGGQDADGRISFTAEEWLGGVAHAAAYQTQVGEGGGQDTRADPCSSNPPAIFAPPLAATENGTPELWIGTSGAVQDWGGARVFVSWDAGQSYSYVGDARRATYGLTSSSVQAGAPLDTANTLQVDLRASGGTLTSVSDQDRDALASACWLDGEIVSFKTAALVSAGVYNLTSLRRGCHGTVSAAHSAGSPFIKLDSGILRLPIDPSRYGQTVYVKLVSFNLSKTYVQDPATVPVHAYQLPPAPQRMPVAKALPVRFTFDSFEVEDWEVSGSGVVSLVSGGLDGGRALRASGPLTAIHKTLIPVNTSTIYCLSATYRQVSNPTTGGKGFQVGLVGVAEDGTTLCNIAGANASSSQHMVAAQSNDPGSWYQANGYWQGRATPGTVAGSLTAPGAMHANVRYVRLAVLFNDANGDGVQDLDALELFDAAAQQAGVGVTDRARTYYQSTAPEGALTIGDLWFNTSANCAPFRWSGTQWISIHDTSAIVAAQIAAGLITADKLSFGTGTNLLPNGDFSSINTNGNALTYFTGHEAYTDVSGISWGVAGGDGSHSLNGCTDIRNRESLNVVYMHQNDRKGTGALTCTLVMACPRRLPVEPGKRYVASAYVGAEQANAFILIVFRDANGSAVLWTGDDTPECRNYQEKFWGTQLSDYKRVYCSAVAPANACTASVQVCKYDTAAGFTYSYVWICRAQFEEAHAGQTLPSPWAPAARTVIDRYSVVSDVLATSNYAEDANGIPTAGAKLDHLGTALKVAAGNLRVGSKLMSNMIRHYLGLSQGSQNSFQVDFSSPMPDTSYAVYASPRQWSSGTPPIGAFTITGYVKSTDNVICYTHAAPGATYIYWDVVIIDAP